MKKRIKYIMTYMGPYRLQFIIVFIIVLVTTAIVAFYPYLFGQLVDTLFYGKNVPVFFRIVLIYMCIYIINQILHYCLDVMVAKLRINYSFAIRKSLFHKVLTYKSEELSGLNTGDMMSRINKDAEEALNFVYHDIFYGISALLDFCMCLGMIAFINIYLAGIAFILTIVTFSITKAFEKRLKPLYEKVTKLSAKNSNWLFEFLNGMRDIRLIHAADRCIDKYIEGEMNAVHLNYDIAKKEMLSDRANNAVQTVSMLIIYTVAAVLIIGNTLTLGSLVACIDYFNRMVLVLDRMYVRIFTISRRMVSIDRIMEIESKKSEDDTRTKPSIKIEKGEIIFSNVSFSYTKQMQILDHFDLHIKAGEKTALVGKSGEGKSTIVELLCRLYDADEGEILIDGQNINAFEVRDLRRQVGIVSQSITIFNNSVRYNLIFTNNEERDEEIWNVLRLVEMDKVIKNLTNGLDTNLSSTNMGLSGGQRQRLAIARVYLKKAKILIFDEATSAVDGNTESNIMKSWEKIFPGYTILIITHRLSTIIRCDRIAYLENGRILGCDTHIKLMESCLPYRHLFEGQYAYHFEKEGEGE